MYRSYSSQRAEGAAVGPTRPKALTRGTDREESSFVVLNIFRGFFTHFLFLPRPYSSLLQSPSQLHGQFSKLGDEVV